MKPSEYNKLTPGRKVAKLYPDYPTDFDWVVVEKVAPSSVKIRSTVAPEKVVVMPAYLLLLSGGQCV